MSTWYDSLPKFAPRPAGKINGMKYSNNVTGNIFNTPEDALLDGEKNAKNDEVVRVTEGNIAFDDNGNEVLEVWHNDYYNITQ